MKSASLNRPAQDPPPDAAAKPRIVIFTAGLAVGGAERHSVDLRARLRARGFPTGLVVYGSAGSGVIQALEGAEDPEFLGIKGIANLKGWRRIWRSFRAQDADVILAVNQTALIVAVLARLMGATRAKVAGVFHTTLLRPGEERRLFAFRGAARLADALVYISRNQKAYWENRGLSSRRTPVILNGIDLPRFQPNSAQRALTRARLGLADTDLVLGLVAAFRPEKNHAQLLDALAALRKRGVPAKALLVGDGPTRPAVVAQAATLGVEAHVVFAGEQADVRPYIQASDIGVLCSTAVETFSLAMLEFLACGVPVVMSDIGGASEIVRAGENGCLFGAGKTDELVECLERLAPAEERARLAGRARSSVAGLTIEHMADQYAALLTNLHRE